MVIRVSVLCFTQRCCAVATHFFRIRKQGMGTGQSLVRAIGEVHKGCIWERTRPMEAGSFAFLCLSFYPRRKSCRRKDS